MGLTKDLGALPRAITVSSVNNVGIGISSPLSMLHAKGSGYSTLTLEGGTNQGTGIRFFGDVQYAEIFGEYESATNGQMFFRTRKAGTISTAMTITSGGNIGIGTTSPTAKLHISESTYGTGLLINTSSINGADITLTCTASGGKRWDITSGGPNNGIGAGGLQFYNETDGAMRMGIASSGNVLIGTTTDAGYKLDVNGTFRASSGNSSASVRAVYTNNSTYAQNSYSGISGIAVENISTVNGTGAGIIFIPKTTTGACIASIGAINESNSYASSLVFQTRTAGGSDSERMRLRSDGSLSNNGVKTQYASGYSDISTTFYIDFPAYPSTPYKIIAAITHWIAAYGAYRESIEFNNAYTDLSELVITNHSSTAGGSWSISRPDNSTLRITHNGGNYAAYGNWWIQVIGN